VHGVCKSFGSTRALIDVSVAFAAGEVHALVGENGAGKSTLVKILSGTFRPDAGKLILGARTYAPHSPHDARRRGVAVVYQELALAPELSVEANMFLGMERTRFGCVRQSEQRRMVRRVLDELQHPEIAPDRRAGDLVPAAQQLVEIGRAMLFDVGVLILDEPTSSLTRADVDRLFGLIRRMRERGACVIYISHFLEEIETIADRFTVLRDGRLIGGGTVAATRRREIIEMMVGRSVESQYPRIPHQPGDPVMSLCGLSGDSAPKDVDLVLHRGEILGIAGIVGAGRTELLRSVYGLRPVVAGEVIVRSVTRTHAVPRQRIAQGFGYLSESRKEEGLALDRSIVDNMSYPVLQRYSRYGWLAERRRLGAVRQWTERLGIRCRAPEQAVADLSGGNQQKVALARLLLQGADIFLLDEPTRGIDVASKAEIYRLIGELAARGTAVIMVSSYLPELFGICDRLAVMFRGRLSTARPTECWTVEEIMAYATGEDFSSTR
jgi:ribose transport system ATP-binding protein